MSFFSLIFVQASSPFIRLIESCDPQNASDNQYTAHVVICQNCHPCNLFSITTPFLPSIYGHAKSCNLWSYYKPLVLGGPGRGTCLCTPEKQLFRIFYYFTGIDVNAYSRYSFFLYEDRANKKYV